MIARKNILMASGGWRLVVQVYKYVDEVLRLTVFDIFVVLLIKNMVGEDI